MTAEKDWMAEAARYCQPHGEKHDDLTCLRLLAEAALPGGRWSADLDSCDCGDGYGCSHGSWVHAVHVENTHSQSARQETCDPAATLDAYAHDRSEMSDFSWDEAHYIVAAQPSAVLGLLDRLARVETLAASWEVEASHPEGHPLLTQTYRNLARSLRGALAEPTSRPAISDGA